MARSEPGPAAPDYGDWAFISLGSNRGDSAALLARATQALESLSPKPLLRSSLWRSTPLDCPPGSPDFLNAVVGLLPRQGTAPEDLLSDIQTIERAFGRRRGPTRHAPRPLDLDLLVFGSELRSTQTLSLPHPRAHLRRFVLAPWDEVAPRLVLPIVGMSVRELLVGLPPGQHVERLDR